MKKTALLMLTVMASLGFTACNNTCDSSKTCSKGNDKEVLYSGVLPAADADGTVYTLKLEFDEEHNYTDGDFTMVETSMVTDTVSVQGMKVVATSYSKGDFRKESKVVDGATVDYIRLVPDAKDALGTPSASSDYFIINADESLTMVGADLQKAVNPEMNYTLTVVK